MSIKADDITKLNLYEFLDINENANDQEIKKAFRQKALKCHPDKNPDDPKAADQFQRYTKATEILLDSAARTAYDRVLRARKDHAARNKHLDSKRKKFKDDLEAKEKAAQENEEEINVGLNLEKEIERLRKQGSKELERQNEELKRQIQEEIRARLIQKETPIVIDNDVVQVRIKFKKNDYDERHLKEIFSKYGNIIELAMSRKANSAIIEYKTYREANNATTALKDRFEISIITPKSKTGDVNEIKRPFLNEPILNANSDDFENNVLMKLKRAQEKRRLMEESGTAQ